jgi:hexosaminidase
LLNGTINSFSQAATMRNGPFFILVLICSTLSMTLAQKSTTVNIVPKPSSVIQHAGSFNLTSGTMISCPDNVLDQEFVAEFLSKQLSRATGFKMTRTNVWDKSKSAIVLKSANNPDLGEEGYELSVGKNQVQISANTRSGLLYGVQTFLQLLPPEVYKPGRSSGKNWSIPFVEIKDSPRFRWRGMHLDVSRHFLPKEFIKTYIDILAMHKLNVFHWHLTDDQGWRIEIKKYPKLTEVAAWRVDREDQPWSVRDAQRPGERPTLGGFYTQDEIKEIVRYASERNITVVPEIEMPAHTTALLAAYPQYSCTGGPFTVPPGGVWPITDIFCAGNDSTFFFLQDILTEVMDLFPSTFIHVGGDEADKKEWRVCPKCQARIRSEHLKDETELQSYFVQRIEKFLNSHNRRLIGWDEILEGGIASNAAVMSWRGNEGGMAAAKQGHDAVMTPGSHTYLNCYQGKEESEPVAEGGYLPISKVYSYEPVPEGLTREEATHIIGAQGCLWGEYVSTPEHAEYMLLPRLAAIAEVVWSPRESRSWNDFASRLEHQMKRYEARGYHYSKSAYLATITPFVDTVKKQLKIALANEMNYPSIRYTLDGSQPTMSSQSYKDPFAVSKATTVKAGAFSKGKLLGSVSSQKIFIHKASFKPIRLKYLYERYTGGGEYGLVNGLRGSMSFADGNWQGFHQADLDAVIDLQKPTSIKRIAAGFLERTSSWIFYPTLVEFSVSSDGEHFTNVAKFEMAVPGSNREMSIKELSQNLKNVKARFIRVYAKNVGVCPDWHSGKGDKAWLFVDEIVVE